MAPLELVCEGGASLSLSSRNMNEPFVTNTPNRQRKRTKTNEKSSPRERRQFEASLWIGETYEDRYAKVNEIALVHGLSVCCQPPTQIKQLLSHAFLSLWRLAVSPFTVRGGFEHSRPFLCKYRALAHQFCSSFFSFVGIAMFSALAPYFYVIS